MRGAIVTNKAGVEKQKKINYHLIKKHFLIPFTGGIFGYLGFFILLIISKFFGYLIGNNISFKIDFTDLLLPLLGFAFIFIVKLNKDSEERG